MYYFSEFSGLGKQSLSSFRWAQPHHCHQSVGYLGWEVPDGLSYTSRSWGWLLLGGLCTSPHDLSSSGRLGHIVYGIDSGQHSKAKLRLQALVLEVTKVAFKDLTGESKSCDLPRCKRILWKFGKVTF